MDAPNTTNHVLVNGTKSINIGENNVPIANGDGIDSASSSPAPSSANGDNNRELAAAGGRMSRSMHSHIGSMTGSPAAAATAPNLSVILTIRLLMQGKEVGSIIGKKGDHIKIIRDESNAKINISDGSCPERIVTITGNVDTIQKAFTMICRKFEDDMQQMPNSVPKPPITFRLIVPATQCGSLIGKGGSKIKEIREATGASIQVASEMLPNSTERAVTISGAAEAIITCMQQISQILLESPPKGATIPYKPKPSVNPLLLATNAAAAATGQQTAVLQPGHTNIFSQYSPDGRFDLTKIHPLHPLLQTHPGFNPTVFTGTPFTAAAGLIPIQPAPSAQTTALLHHPDLAMAATGANMCMATGTVRNDNGKSYNSSRSSDMDSGSMHKAHHQQAAPDAATAAALSQYMMNTRWAAIPATTYIPASSIAAGALYHHHHQQHNNHHHAVAAAAAQQQQHQHQQQQLLQQAHQNAAAAVAVGSQLCWAPSNSQSPPGGLQ